MNLNKDLDFKRKENSKMNLNKDLDFKRKENSKMNLIRIWILSGKRIQINKKKLFNCYLTCFSGFITLSITGKTDRISVDTDT